MSRILIALAGALTVMVPFSSRMAAAEIDYQECKSQIEKIARVDVACTIKIDPSENERSTFMQTTKGVYTGYSCKSDVSFNKSDVYNKWILTNTIKFPQAVVYCSAFSNNLPSTSFTTNLNASCNRQNEMWKCDIKVNIDGLGFLARAIENEFISKLNISEQMEKLFNK